MAKKDYDSGFCGNLPLNHLNHIQAYGFLLVCDKQLQIVQLSENSQAFLGLDKDTILNTLLTDLLVQETAETLVGKINSGTSARFSQVVQFNSNPSQAFLLLCHLHADLILMEFEPHKAIKNSNLPESYLNINEASGIIHRATDLGSALQVAASELKKFSGFDKVMIYKFDEEWNGHVLAEEMEPDMESYLGITFPASDIPKQARQLYLKNPYRQIPDREYTASRLYPVINPVNNGFVDMSDCNLRGIVSVHLEYLANMKVCSSMSTRILKDNTLWGLIACHHKEAKFLHYDECSVFELLSGIISSKLSSLDTQQHLNDSNKLQALYNKIVEDIYAENNLGNGVRKCAEKLMTLLDSSGLAHCSEGKISSYGECPSASSIHELVIWLESKNLKDVYLTSDLFEEFEDSSGSPMLASGIFAFPVLPSRGEFIILFRKEILKSINWGGNPNEAILFEEDMKTYHPRHSFTVWREEVKNSSAPYTTYEIEAGRNLLRIFTEVRIKELN